jgi:ABC-type taurine transport system ATPase subunit
MHHKSTELRGGHRQRVAIARVELIIDVLRFQPGLGLQSLHSDRQQGAFLRTYQKLRFIVRYHNSTYNLSINRNI